MSWVGLDSEGEYWWVPDRTSTSKAWSARLALPSQTVSELRILCALKQFHLFCFHFRRFFPLPQLCIHFYAILSLQSLLGAWVPSSESSLGMILHFDIMLWLFLWSIRATLNSSMMFVVAFCLSFWLRLCYAFRSTVHTCCERTIASPSAALSLSLSRIWCGVVCWVLIVPCQGMSV